MVLRQLLLLIAAASTGVVMAAFAPEALPIVQEAASLALEIYEDAAGPPVVEEAMDKGQVTSAAMRLEHDDRCLIAFRGAEKGFNWISNIDLRRSKVASLTRPGRSCRVVKQYKWEFAQNRHQKKYRKSVRDFASGCAANNKLVVFVGHDFGGALATLWGLAFEELKENKMIITFGQAPVFMPPQYNQGLINAPGILGAGPGGRGCRHIDDESYLPFVNSQEVLSDGSTPPTVGLEKTFDGILYDFMYFLNVAVYSLIGDSSLTDAVCLTKAATHVESFISSPDAKGNLGGPLGQFVLLPPMNTTKPNGYFIYKVDPPRYRTFRNYIPFGDAPAPLFSADLLSYPVECTAEGGIHSMEAYFAKLNAVTPVDMSIEGLEVGTPCNYAYECQSQSCGLGECRPRGRPARMRKFRK